MMAAAVLGVFLLLVVVYQFMPSSSTIASTTPATTAIGPEGTPMKNPRATARRGSGPALGKKERPPQNLAPALHLEQLAPTEQITSNGPRRNISVWHPDP